MYEGASKYRQERQRYARKGLRRTSRGSRDIGRIHRNAGKQDRSYIHSTGPGAAARRSLKLTGRCAEKSELLCGSAADAARNLSSRPSSRLSLNSNETEQ